MDGVIKGPRMRGSRRGVRVGGGRGRGMPLVAVKHSIESADHSSPSSRGRGRGSANSRPGLSNIKGLDINIEELPEDQGLETPLHQNKIRRCQQIVVFAGDISPIEIMCHLPAVCEEKDVPYCYTPSRKDIGAAMGTTRGCIMVLIKENGDYKDLYDEVKSEIKLLGHPL